MKTYKFKLYSNHGNRELHKTIDGHADVWNHCVALQRRYYAIYSKYISKFRLINHISKLKRLPRFTHWNQLPSQAIQDVASRIDKGYRAMFEARSQGKAWGRPRFKPRRKYKSFTLLQAGCRSTILTRCSKLKMDVLVALKIDTTGKETFKKKSKRAMENIESQLDRLEQDGFILIEGQNRIIPGGDRKYSAAYQIMPARWDGRKDLTQ